MINLQIPLVDILMMLYGCLHPKFPYITQMEWHTIERKCRLVCLSGPAFQIQIILDCFLEDLAVGAE